MKRIITILLVSLIGFSTAISQPLAEGGYFFDDFSSPSFTGISYTAFTASTVPGFTSITKRPGGSNAMVYHIGSTLGNNTDPSAGGSGAQNFIQVQFYKPTAGYFSKQSAMLTLTVSSPVSVLLRGAILNYDGANGYSSFGNYYSNPPNYYAQAKTINTGGVKVINYDFSSIADNANFYFSSSIIVYLSYNIGVSNSPTNATVPAADITFLGVSFGTPMTDYDLTYSDISNSQGLSNMVPNVSPTGVSGLSTYAGVGAFDPIIKVITVDGISGLAQAKGTANGIASVTGTSLIYPYLSKTIAIYVTNNPPVAPESIDVNPKTGTLGRTESLALTATTLPLGNGGVLSWTSSNTLLGIVSITGNGTSVVKVPANAPAGVVTITAMTKQGSVSFTSISVITVQALMSFDLTFAGVNPTLTFSGINPVGISTIGGISWSVAPATIATINATTGVLKVRTDGDATVTGISGSVTIKKLFSFSVTPVIVTTTGVSDALVSSAVKVYPNPASSVLNVSVEGTVISTIYLVNSAGQTVLTTSGATTIPLYNIQKGFYILIIETPKGTARKAVSIE